MDVPKDTLSDYLEKDARSNTSRIVSAASKDAKKAVLEYNVMATVGKMQLLEIHLLTGRHHQIRVQFAGREHPLLGDTKYGTPESVSYSREINIRVPALCAYKLIWNHPVTGKELSLSITPENSLIQGMSNC